MSANLFYAALKGSAIARHCQDPANHQLPFIMETQNELNNREI
jgi:hypothetical protein